MSLLAGPALIGIAIVHIALGSRSLAGITAATGLLALCTLAKSSDAPSPYKPGVILASALAALVIVTGAYYGAKLATEARLLPEDVQTKMELQFSSPYGLIAAARPDAAAALYAISKRPITGHGSTGQDPDVLVFYAVVASSSFIERENHDAIQANQLGREFKGGTPAHSHILGAWADAGVFATFCWIAVLVLASKVLARVALWKHPLAPLYTFIAMTTIWDVLFSPGPHRMDIAIRLMILTHAEAMLGMYDSQVASWARRSSTRMRPSRKHT
jgi:O-antigen ligase